MGDWESSAVKGVLGCKSRGLVRFDETASTTDGTTTSTPTSRRVPGQRTRIVWLSPFIGVWATSGLRSQKKFLAGVWSQRRAACELAHLNSYRTDNSIKNRWNSMLGRLVSDAEERFEKTGVPKEEWLNKMIKEFEDRKALGENSTRRRRGGGDRRGRGRPKESRSSSGSLTLPQCFPPYPAHHLLY